MSRVRGQQPLPGAPESLLSATDGGRGPVSRSVSEYHAISIQRRTDGTWRAMRLTLDRSSGKMVPKLLDAWDDATDVSLSPAEALLYWAQQAVLDERGVLE